MAHVFVNCSFIKLSLDYSPCDLIPLGADNTADGATALATVSAQLSSQVSGHGDVFGKHVLWMLEAGGHLISPLAGSGAAFSLNWLGIANRGR